jgi:hypothetical protein
LIVFTIKNSRTDTVYIGTTKDSVDERWAQLQLAKDHGLESALYDDMRNYGIACFSIEEYDFAETREELNEMFSEAMTQYKGVSLKGMKMAIPRTAIYVTNEGREIDTRIASPSKAAKSAKAEKEVVASVSVSTGSSSGVRKTSTTSVSSQTAKRKAQLENDLSTIREKPKLATGRTGSAIKEKRIKEAIALEKLEREALKKRQVNEQADEMKAILANLDARGSTLRKRY